MSFGNVEKIDTWIITRFCDILSAIPIDLIALNTLSLIIDERGTFEAKMSNIVVNNALADVLAPLGATPSVSAVMT